ncbi:MAG: AAA family ATPase [Candidatus Methanomethylophilaceae archaeon]|nr:AAA family ATPase [Candidatus Methanomethylophilaceae archaeon]MBR4225570.1 AAA family ATPase [Candidatus Methanomethylophilaceae archaeon]
MGAEILFLKGYFDSIDDFSSNRDGLLELVEECFLSETGTFTFAPKFMDPFSPLSMALGLGPRDRIKVLSALRNALGIVPDVPEDIRGIPRTDSRRALTYRDGQVDELWNLFHEARASPSDDAALAAAFDSAVESGLSPFELAVSLSWMSPLRYCPLCSEVFGFYSDNGIRVPDTIDGRTYLSFCRLTSSRIRELGYDDLPSALDGNVRGRTDRAGAMEVISSLRTAREPRPYGREDFLSETLLPASDLSAMMSLLSSWGCVVLRGPSGVGKSFSARRLAYCLVGSRDDSKVFWIQMHPSMTYEDMVVGVLPDEDGAMCVTQGWLMNLCDIASDDPESNFVLVLDDLDLVDPRAVLGEALSLFGPSRRDEVVPIRYGQDLSIPKNLMVIGTSTARQPSRPDLWVLHRLPVFDMEPDFDAVLGSISPGLAEDMRALDSEIASELGKGSMVGHCIFIGRPASEAIEREVLPYLRDIWSGDPGRADSWGLRLLSHVRR